MAASKKATRKTNSSGKAAVEQKAPNASVEAAATPATDRRGGDRRAADRRQRHEPVAVERRAGQRRKVQRRRQIDPTTCERDYTSEEIEFMNAMDEYKRTSGRMFPTCSEVLEVVRNLGYRKLSEMEALGQPACPAPAGQAGQNTAV